MAEIVLVVAVLGAAGAFAYYEYEKSTPRITGWKIDGCMLYLTINQHTGDGMDLSELDSDGLDRIVQIATAMGLDETATAALRTQAQQCMNPGGAHTALSRAAADFYKRTS